MELSLTNIQYMIVRYWWSFFLNTEISNLCSLWPISEFPQCNCPTFEGHLTCTYWWFIATPDTPSVVASISIILIILPYNGNLGTLEWEFTFWTNKCYTSTHHASIYMSEMNLERLPRNPGEIKAQFLRVFVWQHLQWKTMLLLGMNQTWVRRMLQHGPIVLELTPKCLEASPNSAIL